jgi:hypothetical protein
VSARQRHAILLPKHVIYLPYQALITSDGALSGSGCRYVPRNTAPFVVLPVTKFKYAVAPKATGHKAEFVPGFVGLYHRGNVSEQGVRLQGCPNRVREVPGRRPAYFARRQRYGDNALARSPFCRGAKVAYFTRR